LLARVARRRRVRRARARVGRRAGDAPLPRGARDRARRPLRGDRAPAVRRPAVRALRRPGTRTRRRARARDERGGMSPPPAIEAAPRLPGHVIPGELSALRTVRARGRLRGRLALLGPAFVAAVAYIDPGNFATNIAGGAKYGYL